MLFAGANAEACASCVKAAEDGMEAAAAAAEAEAEDESTAEPVAVAEGDARSARLLMLPIS